MISLEVEINGRRLCVAGLASGSVTATVATSRRKRRQRPGRTQLSPTESAHLAVAGYTETATAHEHPWWVSPKSMPRLRVGDSVTLRVVNSTRPDKPRTRHRHSKHSLACFIHEMCTDMSTTGPSAATGPRSGAGR
jgi:hypothetical protein